MLQRHHNMLTSTKLSMLNIQPYYSIIGILVNYHQYNDLIILSSLFNLIVYIIITKTNSKNMNHYIFTFILALATYFRDVHSQPAFYTTIARKF